MPLAYSSYTLYLVLEVWKPSKTISRVLLSPSPGCKRAEWERGLDGSKPHQKEKRETILIVRRKEVSKQYNTTREMVDLGQLKSVVTAFGQQKNKLISCPDLATILEPIRFAFIHFRISCSQLQSIDI